jgi:hypothetical protein
MSFSFGDWTTIEKIFDELGISAGELGSELEKIIPRLSVTDLYVDNIHANSLEMVWLSPEGNIDLTQIGDNLDNLLTGSTYGKLKSTAMDANGMILLDLVVEGTHGLLRATDIYGGHIKLTSYVSADGKWYNKSGVVLDADYGIGLYGGQIALRTFPTYADLLAGTNLQCYVGTDGKIYAGGGKVGLSAAGVLIDCDAGGGDSVLLDFKYGIKHGYARLNVSGDLVLDSYTSKLRVVDGVTPGILQDTKVTQSSETANTMGSINPASTILSQLGDATHQWLEGYFSSRLKIPVGTNLYD